MPADCKKNKLRIWMPLGRLPHGRPFLVLILDEMAMKAFCGVARRQDEICGMA